ncbi:DUF7241 domain-containing protein [Antarcticirhabdus aurantiaca]|uniref:Uncharacterized protein n=1 Tax=Antarcticirhabdus aurantiaca TaxID=2606717 RepID=A0ACD4NKX8_9HYPH|nr:hypothetical protein [Antarcticirhabdus aurantiaca]WAJ27558.1 hypothetical protein OXU80_22355 [Jeongeuplla avenae]
MSKVSTGETQILSDAEVCRINGWQPGTRLVGDEGFGPTIIEITAVGRDKILGVMVAHKGRPYEHDSEAMWTLACRDWRRV